MKNHHYITVPALVLLALSLLAPSFAAKAQSEAHNQVSVQKLQEGQQLQGQQLAAQQKWDVSAGKTDAFEQKISEKITRILKGSDEQTNNDVSYMTYTWLNYQKAMTNAIETSYTERKAHGGAQAAADFNLMADEDFIKTLDYFFKD